MPTPDLQDPVAARQADAEWLSVALMDARNRTLRWLSLFEEAQGLEGVEGGDGLPPPGWLVGRAAWLQEWWVARHVQRLRGEAADASGPRLPSIHPRADAWFASPPGLAGSPPPSSTAGSDKPGSAELRAYLADTLETTLELLAGLSGSAAGDAALHGFRLALRHEDRLSERLACAAQWQGVPVERVPGLGAAPPVLAPREPLWVPSRRFRPGAAPGEPGLVPLNERGGEDETVPEFEIDAQVVTWARYAEFVREGGYDDERLWSTAGWEWLARNGRRAPRAVEQLGTAVLVQRFGRLVRVPGAQAAVHVSFHEAEAWCRWAQRRLPTEIEWELAARHLASRGFTWGAVREWAAGRARLWPGAAGQRVAGFAAPDPARGLRVLRGASSWTSPRDAHVQARVFIDPGRDEAFSGFRSCAP